MHKIIVGGSNSRNLAKKIAKQLQLPHSELLVRKFPDGDSYVKFQTNVRNAIVTIVNSMHPNPNDALIELLFAAQTAKELGASKVILVVPYMAYLRQDKRFHEGEVVSNKIVAKLLSFVEEIVTVDPHLHRISSLSEIFEHHTKAVSLTAVTPIATFIKKLGKDVLLIGPDIESSQWADTVAKELGKRAVILHKKRYNSHTVRTKVKLDNTIKGKTVVLVDDIISTGHTMIEPIKQLKKMGAKKIYCIGVHGIFADNALNKLKKLGVIVISCNTIENPVSLIDVSGLISEAL